MEQKETVTLNEAITVKKVIPEEFIFCPCFGSIEMKTVLVHGGMVGRTIFCADHTEVPPPLNMAFLKIPGVDILHIRLQFN